MTRLKLKSMVYLLPFWIQNEQVVHQLRSSQGFLKGKELATPNLSMWTATLWDSREDIRDFYLSGSHKKVMRNIDKWSSEAVTGHQEVDFLEIPDWEQIRQELTRNGYFINLKDASSKHQCKIISQPKITLLTRYISPILE